MILTDGVTPVTLPDDLLWTDEHTWSPVVQDANHSLSGSLIVETDSKQAGRPITLQSPQNQAVITGAVLAQLKTWAAIPGKVLSLTIRGDVKAVVFRHQNTGIDADVIGFWCDTDDMSAARYFITLRFLEI